MKVICIDDYDLSGRKVKLTPGKIYDVYLHLDHNESWAITNDDGIQRWYYNDVLMPLEKWREIRLKELGI
jgi:hypothetical protein